MNKLPVNRNKPVGRSISAADVAKLVASSGARRKAVGKPVERPALAEPQSTDPAAPKPGRSRGGS